MQLNFPVFQIAISGNVKEKIKSLNFVAAASYEPHKGQTFVFVKSQLLNRSKKKETEKTLQETFKGYGKIISINYFPDGADIIQMTTNN